MFTPDERAEIAGRVVAALESDARVERVHGFGSIVDGTADRHSDVDLAVLVRDGADPARVAADWVERICGLVPVVHRFHEQVGPAEVCGFLLANHLEVDVGFGDAEVVASVLERDPPDHLAKAREWLDFAWHDVVHAAVAIERGRRFRALFYIDRVRDRAIELACLRLGLGLDERHHKSADDLPSELQSSFESAVPRSLETDELERALRAASRAFYSETRHIDAETTDRLEDSLLAYFDELASVT